MDSEHPPSSRVDAAAIASARGALRDSLGGLRNLTQLLHSVRVAPKSLAVVLPHVLEACTPMRAAVRTLLEALERSPRVDPAQQALSSFFFPRIDLLEVALREATTRPLNAKTRLALEDVVAKSSTELDSARELLQLLEDSNSERSVRLLPRELVREAFSSPARSDAHGSVSATLATHDCGNEIEINPRVAMVLVALGVELVGATPGSAKPHIAITSDGRAMCTIRISRTANSTGEPLTLRGRGVIEPTLPCLRAAAALTRGRIDWIPGGDELSLSYPIDGAARTA